MRVLVDTNIVLDALLERESFVEDARALIRSYSRWADSGVCNGNNPNQHFLHR